MLKCKHMKSLEISTVAAPEKASEIADVAVHYVDIADKYISDEATYNRINSEVEELMAMGYYGDTSLNFERKRKSSIDYENPSTAELFRRLPSFGDWLSMVPTAGALDALYYPEQEYFANGKKVDPELRNWLRNIADGVGIRSRGEIVKNILAQEALVSGEKSNWLSLASGAAQPVLRSAADVVAQGGQTPNITLVDYDAKILGLAKKYAREVGVEGSLTRKRMNILRAEGIDYSPSSENLALAALRKFTGLGRLPRASYDIVEAVGIVEYLKYDDWSMGGTKKYQYGQVINEGGQKMPFAGARSFLKNSYRLLKPGGLMVVGNMLDTHPQLGFTLNVIQWPHIQPRSIEDMVRLFRQAGLDGEIDTYVPKDGVYAIYTIRKSE